MKTIYTTILLLFFYVEKLPSQDCIEGISIKSAFNEDELFNFKNTQDEYHYNLLFDKPEYTRTYLKIYDNDTIYF